MTGDGSANEDEDDEPLSSGRTVVHYSGADEPVSTTVVDAVAEATGNEPAALEPLGRVVDTHSLDRLFSPLWGPSNGPRMGAVEFRFEGCLVTVSAAGWVEVRETDDDADGC